MSHTKDIHIHIESQYIAEQSDPTQSQYLFAYTIRIENRGSIGVQIISRHWLIENASQRRQEVRGLGVVGEQPFIEPGHSYEYTSMCPLDTAYGTMRGSYHCVGENGIPFDVEIPLFMLNNSTTLH